MGPPRVAPETLVDLKNAQVTEPDPQALEDARGPLFHQPGPSSNQKLKRIHCEYWCWSKMWLKMVQNGKKVFGRSREDSNSQSPVSFRAENWCLNH